MSWGFLKTGVQYHEEVCSSFRCFWNGQQYVNIHTYRLGRIYLQKSYILANQAKSGLAACTRTLASAMKDWNTALGKDLAQPYILTTYFHIDLAIQF